MRRPRRPAGALGRRLATWAPFALGGVVLFAAYLRISRTQPVNSDGASNALQAWDMLHGNLLLHGWWLSDVSFYTTELPQYMLVEAVRGLNADVVHVAAATYTLLVLLSALLARGDASGREAVLRMALAAGIVLAPQLGTGAYVLLLSPDHVGTSVFVLATWLVLDWAGRRRWVPPAMAALLAWGMVGDRLVLYIAVVPLAAVCVLRAWADVVVRRRALAQARFELGLAVAAVAAVPVAWIATALIRAHGGYHVWGTHLALTSTGELTRHLRLTLGGIAVLYGASFTGLNPGLAVVLAAVHLAGLALAGWALWLGLRRFLAPETSVVTAVLPAAVVINLVLYLVSTRVADVRSARDMAAVLPFGAVLAGRLLAGRLLDGRLRAVMAPLLGAGLLGYAAALVYGATQPPAPAAGGQLTTWLAGRDLHYGVGDYWNANAVSLASGGSVQVRPVCYGGGRFTAYRWEAQSSWYDPSRHRANFLVLAPRSRTSCLNPTYLQFRATFGPPVDAYRVGPDTVLVWNMNLLARVRVATAGGPISRGRAPPPSPR